MKKKAIKILPPCITSLTGGGGRLQRVAKHCYPRERLFFRVKEVFFYFYKQLNATFLNLRVKAVLCVENTWLQSSNTEHKFRTRCHGKSVEVCSKLELTTNNDSIQGCQPHCPKDSPDFTVLAYGIPGLFSLFFFSFFWGLIWNSNSYPVNMHARSL